MIRAFILSLTAALAVASLPAAAAERAITVAAGQRARIVESGFNPATCISHGEAAVTVFDKPLKGQLKIEREIITITDDPTGRTRCGGQKVPGAVVYYTPSKGFKGNDKFGYRVQIGKGVPHVQTYNVTVR